MQIFDQYAVLIDARGCSFASFLLSALKDIGPCMRAAALHASSAQHSAWTGGRSRLAGFANFQEDIQLQGWADTVSGRESSTGTKERLEKIFDHRPSSTSGLWFPRRDEHAESPVLDSESPDPNTASWRPWSPYGRQW